MSRRKDRERVEEMQGRYPEYPGYRGIGQEPSRQGYEPFVAVRCVRCKRKRNVAVALAPKEGEGYVCLACQEPVVVLGKAEQWDPDATV